MATKVKPSRINITGAAQVGQTPVYVDEDCFQWGDIPTDNCQLANGCGYQFTSCMVCDFTSPNNTTYPTTEAVCCYVGQKVAGAYKYQGTVADYEDLPTTGLSEGDVYNITNAHTTAPEFPAGANVAWTGSGWDVLGGVFDLSCKQDVLTAGPNITLSGATICGDFNYAEPTTAAACTTKCVCIPEITQLCVGQRIVVKPSITATNCATNIQLNNFTAYPVRYNNAALTSTTDGYVWGANQLAEFVFDGSYWHVLSKSYDANTTYTMNYSVDAGKYKAGNGSYAISRYVLAMEKDDGTWEKIVATNANYSTGTSKGVNTNGFRLGHIRYYNTTTVVANGALIATNTMNNKAASVDLRYSTNCGGVTNWGEGDYIYIVGTMGNDGLFYLDTTTRWTNKLPTTNDGKLYIRIGICLAAGGYTCSLLDFRPIFYYDNGIKEYKVADNKQDTLVSGTNIKTINGCDVLGCGDLCIAGGVTSVNGQTGDVCLTIPTDNCELANGCGYTTCTGTVSSCSDIISELGYTPYNSTNPCGYTTCTGTVTATDLQCYVQCCDMSGYQLTCNMVCTLSGADDSHYPTAKTVADALSCAGAGDMLKSVYDPCGCNADAFDYCNFHNTPTIPTDNCQLANGCGYTTCTGTLSSCADVISALGYTPYNSTNPCGYTTCTGTLVAADIACLAQCCDIPTDNCQLANGCGYTTCTGTVSTCADVISALGYTPYNATNPCGYTTCTGTVTNADLACYAQCCDIPDTSCFVQESCVACINGCCLTNGGNICIQGGGGGGDMAHVVVVGGGGGGGGGACGAGGGGGGTVNTMDIDISNVSVENVVIGKGGFGGCCLCSCYDCREGGQGGTSSFMGVIAVGGYGGTDSCLTCNDIGKGKSGGNVAGYSSDNQTGGGGAGANGNGGSIIIKCNNPVYPGTGGGGYYSQYTGGCYGGGGGGSSFSYCKGCGVSGGGAGYDFRNFCCTGYGYCGDAYHIGFGFNGGGGGGGSSINGGRGGDGAVEITYKCDCDGCYGGGEVIKCCGMITHRFNGDGIFYSKSSGCKDIRFLLVGGGGGGGGSAQTYGGGGGGGFVIECFSYDIKDGSYPIVIGCGGQGTNCTGNGGDLSIEDGGDSCFNGIVAMGGGGGGFGGYTNCGWDATGRDGGNGGGGGYRCPGGCGLQGCNGGIASNICPWAGGGGGNNSSGVAFWCCQQQMGGGLGVFSDIEGEIKGYGGGGSGGGCTNGDHGTQVFGGGHGANCTTCYVKINATYYGGGGGGLNSCPACYAGNGYQGVFIISYDCNCGYTITGGDCCYLCNGRCIHIFTQNGTLTVS